MQSPQVVLTWTNTSWGGLWRCQGSLTDLLDLILILFAEVPRLQGVGRALQQPLVQLQHALRQVGQEPRVLHDALHRDARLGVHIEHRVQQAEAVRAQLRGPGEVSLDDPAGKGSSCQKSQANRLKQPLPTPLGGGETAWIDLQARATLVGLRCEQIKSWGWLDKQPLLNPAEGFGHVNPAGKDST